MARTIKLVKVSDDLFRSEDASLALHLAFRSYERPARRWYAAWNTFMSGRVEHYGATRATALRSLGAKTRVGKV